jgi:hypothetical protein
LFNTLDHLRISRQKDIAARKDLLITLPSDKIGFLALERSGGSKIICLKDNRGIWSIVEPVNDIADSDMIKDMLAFVSFGRGEVVNKFSPADAGIDKFSVRMGVSLRQGKIGQSIVFGKKTSDGKYIYAAREFAEDIIYKVEYDLVSFLFKDSALFRDRQMFDSSIEKSLKIILRGTPSGKIVFSRTTSGWIMEEPVNWPADSSIIHKLIRKAVEMRSLGIMAESIGNLEDVGLGEKSTSISFVSSDKISTLRLSAGLDPVSTQGVSFQENRKPIFFVNDQLRKDISRHASSYYRNKSLDLFDSLELQLPVSDRNGKKLNSKQKIMLLMQGIKEISITNKTDRLRISNEKILWKGISPEVFIADYNSIFNLIAEIRDLKVKSFLTNKEFNTSKYLKGIKEPEIKMVIKGNDGKYLSQLEIGEKADSRSFYAKTANSAEIFKVSSDFVSLLRRKWFKYHQKILCSFNLNDSLRLSITYNDKTCIYQRTSGDAWQMVKPETKPVDAWALYTGPLSKKNGLGELIALDIIDEVKDDLSIFGLKNPLMRVLCSYKLPEFARVYSNTKTAEISIDIGNTVELSGKKVSYAKLKNGKVVFLIPYAVVDGLKKDFSFNK